MPLARRLAASRLPRETLSNLQSTVARHRHERGRAAQRRLLRLLKEHGGER